MAFSHLCRYCLCGVKTTHTCTHTVMEQRQGKIGGQYLLCVHQNHFNIRLEGFKIELPNFFCKRLRCEAILGQQTAAPTAVNKVIS